MRDLKVNELYKFAIARARADSFRRSTRRCVALTNKSLAPAHVNREKKIPRNDESLRITKIFLFKYIKLGLYFNT